MNQTANMTAQAAANANAALAEAVALFNRGQAPAALQRCRQALATAPRHPGLQQLLASLLLAGGDAGAALSTIAPLLASHPDHAPARQLAAQAGLRQGALLIERGEPAAAAALLRGLTQAQPELIAAWFLLALACEDLHAHDEAAAALGQVLAREPGHVEARLNLGLIEQARGRLDAALDQHALAWRLRPALFGRIAMALCSQPCGAVWLDADALAQELSARAQRQGA
jgi:predicted Zn-dependent protease